MVSSSKLGLEAEFFLIDSKGNITQNADDILARAAKLHPEADIKKECSTNIIEIGSTPSTFISASMTSLLANARACIDASQDTQLLSIGTYPGAYVPKMNPDPLYAMKRDILGETRFEVAGRCVGFHLHHELPEGTFNATQRNIKAVLTQKSKRSLLESYNLTIALDPVLTTFMQSSPFYQGLHIGKDSRVIVYRGGDTLGYKAGLYSEFAEFGQLPEYKQDASELLDMVVSRYAGWKEAIRDKVVDLDRIETARYESVLDTAWNPVKINPHGTLELRGFDMNRPSLIFAISAMVKYIFEDIYDNSLHVVSSDMGIVDYFKEEDGKLYVPPDTYVRKKLQYLSAYVGMENDSIHKYAQAFLAFAKKKLPREARGLIAPFEDMTETRKTTSDAILKQAQSHGFQEGRPLPPAAARAIALHYSQVFLEDIERTEKMVKKYQEV
jgi:hypothetical protein